MHGEVETLAATATRGSGGELEVGELEVGELVRGATLGRYVVLERRGVGGMGVVYAAYDPQLDRKVAIKLVRSRHGPGSVGGGRLRLLREAQAMAKLSHRNVVAVHDVGTVGDQIFVAMEFIEGVSLREWLSAAPRGWPEVVAVFVEAARGLAAAHAQGLVHRDFKPDNVMIDHAGRVVVMDFGLVRASGRADSIELDVRAGAGARESVSSDVHSTGPLDSHLTEIGSLLGTPAYMAPEQLAGGDADARSDQFGFCVALYEALYGERPFGGRTVVEVSAAILDGQIRAEPKGRALPGWLRTVVTRGLASDPASRHASMVALIGALGRDRARRRQIVVAIAVSLGLAGLVVVLGLSLAQRRTEQAIAACEAEGEAIHAVWNGEARARLERALVASGSPFATTSVEHVTAWLDPFVARWASERTQVCVAARVEHTLAPTREAEAIACFEEQRERLTIVLEVFADADIPRVAGAAKAAAAFSQLESCADEQALARRPPVPEALAGDPTLARVRRELARASALADAGEYVEARPVARAALDSSATLGFDPIEAEALLVVATIESEIGDYLEVEALTRRAFTLALASGSDALAAKAAIGLLRVLGYHLARPAEGLAWAEVGQALLVRLGLADSLDAAQLANNVALVHEVRGDLDASEVAHRRALDLRERLLGPDHPETGHSYGNLGTLARLRGDYLGAIAWHRRALEVRERGLGPSHPDVARSLANLGRVELARGELGSALDHFGRSYAILVHTLGAEHRVAARLLADIGEVHRRRGELDRAREHYQRALAIQVALIGELHPETAQSHLGLARVELAAGRLALAGHELEAAAPALASLAADHPMNTELGQLHDQLCADGHAPSCAR